MDNNPISCNQLAHYFLLDGKQLQEQYKDHLSDFHAWSQKGHAEEWLVFKENMGAYLSIDETSLSNGELYTILTNKAGKGRKGTLVAMCRGTAAQDIIATLKRIPFALRNKVKEVTLDMAANMAAAIRHCFPSARRVVDRFHVQKLALDALQELRIAYRWQAIEQENRQIKDARKKKVRYVPEVLYNGDTLKQLLARSRYVLYKSANYWTASQKQRADLLFEKYPMLRKAYDLCQELRNVFNQSHDKRIAFKRLAIWHNKIEDSGIDSFNTVARSIKGHYEYILHYFDNKSTNASAESFNAKIKAFRASFRGVRDTTFFLYRLAKIYA